MKYDQDELRILCEQVDLLSYASKTYDFRHKSGPNYACHCPRHIDNTPSLMIDVSGNYFYCFSCGVSGNIISWLRIFENLTFDEAVEKVAELAGVDMGSLQTSDSLLFYKALRDSKQVVNDTIEREILPTSYYEQFSDELPTEWIEEGIPEDTMRKYEIRIDKKSNRIVYPVYDNDFHLIGAKGRTRFKNFKTLKIMKYMNYKKLQTVDFFAGMKQAADSIQKTKKIIIFEGIKSVMKADAWGYHNCISSETSKINEAQLRLLIRLGVKEVVFAYDQDVDINKIRESTKMLQRFTNVYAIHDKYHLLGDKDAPVDKGRDVWDRLFDERVRL